MDNLAAGVHDVELDRTQLGAHTELTIGMLEANELPRIESPQLKTGTFHNILRHKQALRICSTL
jgi:hypothetical protein